jgi:hypothetical protein
MRRLRVAFAVAVAVACSAARADAQPQPAPSAAQQAKEHFRRGEAADREHNWEDAIREFEAAYTIAPHPDVLFNIAADHEHLEHWAKAAELFQRYLDERDAPAPDAVAVAARIRDLRAKAAGHHRQPAPEPPPPQPQLPPANDAEPPTIEVSPQAMHVIRRRSLPPTTTAELDATPTTPPPPPDIQIGALPTEPASSRWHAAASYGVAEGSSLSERYLVRAGADFAHVVDLDAIGGAFGNNDYALGAMARFMIPATPRMQPFLLGAATAGRAKQDASSRAGTRFPIGVEAGGGVQFGARGRIEVDAVVRYLTGGWGSADTTAFSYANDTIAFAIDIGVAYDIPAQSR